MNFKDKNVWLVGASSGIGAALAPLLTTSGANIALSSRREDALREVAARCRGSGHEVVVKPLDVTDIDAVNRTADELRTVWGGIDVVIYNAGGWEFMDVKDFDGATAIGQIDVNYVGMVRVAGAVVKDMVAKGRGEFVGVASLTGYAGITRAAAYSSSKAGAIAFLQSLRIDLRRYGVNVTTVNPGFVKTRLTEKNPFPMPFIMEADEAAQTILDGLLDGHEEIHFPRRLSWPLKLLTALPDGVYERLARRFMGAS